jgi:putative NADPH-quinone reductase
MGRRILILDGHPDPAHERFVHALAGAYRTGGEAGGHSVLVTRLADMDFPLLRTKTEYERGEPVESVRTLQANFDWANHIVILYPLWLGGMPALLKGALEQLLRPGFGFSTRKLGRWPVKLQSGKSARIIVTMGMPAAIYRFWYGAHSLRALKRNVLNFVGLHRVRASVIGGVETMTDAQRQAWLGAVEKLGRAAQ